MEASLQAAAAACSGSPDDFTGHFTLHLSFVTSTGVFSKQPLLGFRGTLQPLNLHQGCFLFVFFFMSALIVTGINVTLLQPEGVDKVFASRPGDLQR